MSMTLAPLCMQCCACYGMQFDPNFTAHLSVQSHSHTLQMYVLHTAIMAPAYTCRTRYIGRDCVVLCELLHLWPVPFQVSCPDAMP